MCVFESGSYDDIYSIASLFSTIKHIGHKYYSKTLNIYIPTLAKIIMSKALNFQSNWFSYIHQLSVFYISAKTKLVQFCDTGKMFY